MNSKKVLSGLLASLATCGVLCAAPTDDDPPPEEVPVPCKCFWGYCGDLAGIGDFIHEPDIVCSVYAYEMQVEFWSGSCTDGPDCVDVTPKDCTAYVSVEVARFSWTALGEPVLPSPPDFGGFESALCSDEHRTRIVIDGTEVAATNGFYLMKGARIAKGCSGTALVEVEIAGSIVASVDLTCDDCSGG